jgi:peptidoglycan/xylan/chitin deacetylase (PgdA/CDA1 family)
MTRPPAFNRRRFLVGGLTVVAAGCTASHPDASPTPPEPTNQADATTIAPPPPASTATPAPPAQPAPTPTTTGALPPSPPTGQQALYIAHGPRHSDAVALSYHASGRPALAVRLLDLLRDRGVHVTVFAVGTWLDAHPDLGRRIVADGHELANHTLSHLPMRSLSAAQLEHEIVGGAHALIPFIGATRAWFRPSGIDVPTPGILTAAAAAGYPYSIGYDVDTLDFQDPGASAIATTFDAGVQPGSIVSLHFGHQGTIDAMPTILDALARDQRHPVTVSQLPT